MSLICLQTPRSPLANPPGSRPLTGASLLPPAVTSPCVPGACGPSEICVPKTSKRFECKCQDNSVRIPSGADGRGGTCVPAAGTPVVPCNLHCGEHGTCRNSRHGPQVRPGRGGREGGRERERERGEGGRGLGTGTERMVGEGRHTDSSRLSKMERKVEDE